LTLRAVETDPYAAWRGTLRAVLRPEYHREVFYCSELTGVLHVRDCMIEGCVGSEIGVGLCIGHYHRWRNEGKPLGEQKLAWAATQPAQLQGRRPPQKCQVSDCRQGQRSIFCDVHLYAWQKHEDSISPDAWAMSEEAANLCQRTTPCPVAICELDVRLGQPFCPAHLLRWTRNARPPIDQYVNQLNDVGRARYDLRGLPETLRLETQFLLQAVRDRNSSAFPLSLGRELFGVLQRSGIETITAISRDSWGDWWKQHGSSRGLGSVGLLRFASDTLSDLVEGTGWDNEYVRDVWDRKRLGINGRVRRLDFRDITQRRLRDLVKRWCRQRLTAKDMDFNGVAKDLLAMRHLSASLAKRRPGMDLDQIDRGFLEEWFVDMAELRNARTGTPISHSYRKAMLSAVSVLLRDNQRHHWYPEVPVTGHVHSDDYPKHGEKLPRAIPESAMRAIEAPGALEMITRAEFRLITRLHIETGMRNTDIRHLVHWRFLSRDAAGKPYMLFHNSKIGRDAVVPIGEALANALAAWAKLVGSKYPEIAKQESSRPPSSRAGALKLFPSPNANPTGSKAISYSGYNQVLQDWFDHINLVDEVGKPIHVTSHQFRHTYGTRLINADVPAHIVQALLDHTSPTMTAHYARLSDGTIRAAWEAATRKIDGQRAAPDDVLDVDGRLSDAAWSRHRVEQAAALRLANGYCGMSPTKVCEHANPCLSCDLFVPDVEFLDEYRQQLAVTEAVALRARDEGYVRLAEKADQDAVSLHGIIRTVSEVNAAPVRVSSPRLRRNEHARR
jgi:integrase